MIHTFFFKLFHRASAKTGITLLQTNHFAGLDRLNLTFIFASLGSVLGGCSDEPLKIYESPLVRRGPKSARGFCETPNICDSKQITLLV